MSMEKFNKNNKVEKDGQIRMSLFDEKEKIINTYVQKHDIDPAIREMEDAKKEKEIKEEIENIYTEFEIENDKNSNNNEEIKKNEKVLNKKKRKIINLKEIKKRVALKKKEKREKEEEERRKNLPRYPWQDRKDLQ